MAKTTSLCRKTLAAIVLATLPVGASSCCGDGPPEFEQDQRIDPDDPAISELVEACLDNDESCLDLCRKLIDPANGGLAIEAQFSECRIMNEAGTFVKMTYTMPYDCVAGRRPGEMCAHLRSGTQGPVALWLAQMAHLEGAAVHAFARTARELARHGAPEALIRRALVAMVDEVEHAELMAQLAVRAGAQVPSALLESPQPMELFELCYDNLIEGCIREALGAAVMLFQAHSVRDPELARVFARIAGDELRHAELSFDIHRALAPRLLESERQRLRIAKHVAIIELLEDPRASMEPVLIDELGWPDEERFVEIVRGLESGPWRGLV